MIIALCRNIAEYFFFLARVHEASGSSRNSSQTITGKNTTAAANWQGNGIGTSNASNSQNKYWRNIHIYIALALPAIVNFHLLGLFLGFEMDVCVLYVCFSP